MALDLFTPKAPPLCGLDISSSSVKMLEIVDGGKGGFRVERYAIEPLARDAVVDGNINNLEALIDAVKRGHKRLGTRSKHVAMAVPTGAVITKKIVVNGALTEAELEVQVEAEANQYIPFALEEVNLDFQILGPSPTSPDEQEVLIAATRKEKVEDRVAVSESAGGNPLTQEIVTRYGMSPEEAENAKRSGGLPDDFEAEVLRPFMENLSTEVQRALQFFFTSTQYHSVDHILLAGGSAVIPGLDEVVNARAQVPTSIANPFAAMQTSPRVQLKRLMIDAPSLIVACGLAMRRFDPQ